jgi:3D (Asp-Asp-Asp) domain-containing protein
METSGITNGAGFQTTLKEAWYEDTFLITGYNVCLESELSGQLVSGKGLNEKHKKGFLFSARGVPMEGSGLASNGRYIQLKTWNTTWVNNASGNPDHVADEDQVTFEYTTAAQGKYGPITQGTSIAVDPTVIPKLSWVSIDTVGERRADDIGGAIKGAHIDNFLGAGNEVANAWENIDAAKVKFLGIKP